MLTNTNISMLDTTRRGCKFSFTICASVRYTSLVPSLKYVNVGFTDNNIIDWNSNTLSRLGISLLSSIWILFNHAFMYNFQYQSWFLNNYITQNTLFSHASNSFDCWKLWYVNHTHQGNNTETLEWFLVIQFSDSMQFSELSHIPPLSTAKFRNR